MKKRIIIAGVSVTLGLIIVICVTLMFAKYKINLGEQSEITSKNFYFTSDYLKAGEVPVYKIYGNTVTFQVRNYIDSLRINADDINYTVSADFGILDMPSETLITGVTANSQSITLTYNFGNEDQKEITVTAESTGVYTQKLTAKFILLKPEGLAYEIKDEQGSNYAEMYIYTGNTEQNVTLSWDNAKLVIDETNDYVFGKVQNVASPEKSSVEIDNIAADTTVKIVFFKKDITKDYKQDLIKSNGSITIP